MAKNTEDNETFTKPTALLDLERRQAEESGDVEAEGRLYTVEGNELDNYVGVSPEYQNYADETHKPLAGEGAERVVDEKVIEALDNIAEQSKNVGFHGYSVEEKKARQQERKNEKQTSKDEKQASKDASKEERQASKDQNSTPTTPAGN